MASRLFDEQAMTNPNFSSLIREAVGVGGIRMNVVGGPGIHAFSHDFNAVTPAWRTAYAHVSTYSQPSPRSIAITNKNSHRGRLESFH